MNYPTVKVLLLSFLCGLTIADDIDLSAEIDLPEGIVSNNGGNETAFKPLSIEGQFDSAKVLQWVTVTDTQATTITPSLQTTTSTTTVVDTLIVTATPTAAPAVVSDEVFSIPDLKLGSAPVVISGITYVFPGYTALGTEITGPASVLSMFISGPDYSAAETTEAPVSYTDSISYLDTRTYIYVSALSGRVSYTSEEEHWPTCTGEGLPFSKSTSATAATTQYSSSSSSTYSTATASEPTSSFSSSRASKTVNPSSSAPVDTSAPVKPLIPAVFSQKLPGYVCQGYDPSLTSLVCIKSEGNALVLPYHVLALALALAFMVFVS